jgi:hypothetical protein
MFLVLYNIHLLISTVKSLNFAKVFSFEMIQLEKEGKMERNFLTWLHQDT